jgi:hypothetical protein
MTILVPSNVWNKIFRNRIVGKTCGLPKNSLEMKIKITREVKNNPLLQNFQDLLSNLYSYLFLTNTYMHVSTVSQYL